MPSASFRDHHSGALRIDALSGKAARAAYAARGGVAKIADPAQLGMRRRRCRIAPGCGSPPTMSGSRPRSTRFGGQVVMTSPDCANGTERCADAIARLGAVADVDRQSAGRRALVAAFGRRTAGRAAGRRSRGGDGDAGGALLGLGLSSIWRPMRAQGRVGGTTAVFNRALAGALFLEADHSLSARRPKFEATSSRSTFTSGFTPIGPRRLAQYNGADAFAARAARGARAIALPRSWPAGLGRPARSARLGFDRAQQPQ